MQNKKFNFISLFIFILVTSCTPQEIENALNNCTLDLSNTEIRECNTYEEVDSGPKLDYEIEITNFTVEQTQKFQEAMRRLIIVVNSAEFKKRVTEYEYKGENKFIDNNGLSNEEIYEVIMKGEEELIPGIDHTINMSLSMYYKNNSTVGYTYANDPTVYINSKFFNVNSYGKVAGNIIHEWTHKLGFTHSFSNNSDRPHSVPYAVGTIIEELIDEM